MAYSASVGTSTHSPSSGIVTLPVNPSASRRCRRSGVDTPVRLNELLNSLLDFGNYKVSLSIERLKG